MAYALIGNGGEFASALNWVVMDFEKGRNKKSARAC